MQVGNNTGFKFLSVFRQGDIVTKLIFINVAIFLIIGLASVFLRLFNFPAQGWTCWLYLPASFERFLIQPWTLLTYMFVHTDIFHILFNMLWLYWFGKLFLNFFSAKHLRGLYILGGLTGGLTYVIGYHLFPYFSAQIDTSLLMGASASVLAIVVATAVSQPDYAVRFLFIGIVKLKYIALVMIVFDLLLMTSGNAGGHIAHIGGALGGWWFAAGLKKGHDAVKWINQILDFLSGRRIRSKKPKMKVHYATDRQKDYDYNARKKERAEEIDRILDKVRNSGYGSLSEEEKKSLFDASKK